jgi:hypothetical protein
MAVDLDDMVVDEPSSSQARTTKSRANKKVRRAPDAPTVPPPLFSATFLVLSRLFLILSYFFSGGSRHDLELLPSFGVSAASDFLARAAPAFALREPPRYVRLPLTLTDLINQ